MIEEVRLLYAPFKKFVSGHVCLVFKLQDGQEVVISPEAATDRFIILLGFLPFYKLRYSHLKYDDYVTKYQKVSRAFNSTRLDISPDVALQLYEEMLFRVKQLENKKEMYHILLNSCITNTFSHLKDLPGLDISRMRAITLLIKPEQMAYKIINKSGIKLENEGPLL